MHVISEDSEPLLDHEPSSPKASNEPDRPQNGHASTDLNDRSVELDTLPETATFGRNLSWTSAYMLTVSRIVGSGIFATPGNIYKSVNSVGLALTVWVVGAAIAACGLAVSMELGCMLPRSGGTKVYLEFIYRRPRFLASTLVAVSAVLLGFTASNCIVFGEYMLVALGIPATAFAQRTFAVCLLTVITIIHGCFLKTGIWIQDILAWVKIGLMAFIAILGVVALFLPRTGSRQNAETLSLPQLFRGSNWDLVALSTSIFKVSYSFAGYDNVNNVLNEVKNPVQTLKTMAPAALLTVTMFYLMLNIAYFIVVPLEEIKASGELIAALFFDRIFGPSIGSTVLSILVAISAAGNVMVVTFALVDYTTLFMSQADANEVQRLVSIKRSLDKAFCHFQNIFPLRIPSKLHSGASSYTIFRPYSSSYFLRRKTCMHSSSMLRAILPNSSPWQCA